LVESTNKNLINILKKIVNNHQRNWHLSLQNSLWDNIVNPKSSIGNYPFFSLYRQEATFPTHTFLPSLQLDQSVQDQAYPIMQERLDMLLKLEEEREKFNMNLIHHQKIIKKWFEKSVVGNKDF